MALGQCFSTAGTQVYTGAGRPYNAYGDLKFFETFQNLQTSSLTRYQCLNLVNNKKYFKVYEMELQSHTLMFLIFWRERLYTLHDRDRKLGAQKIEKH